MKPKALMVLDPHSRDLIYGPDERRDLDALVEWVGPPQTRDTVLACSGLRAAEWIFSGWGMASLTPALLEAAPALRWILYGAGSIRGFMTDAAWDRGLRVTSAYAANAVPVAEFSLAQILLSLKRVWTYVIRGKLEGKAVARIPVPGAYGSVVGLVSLGMIGRRVAELLRAFDVKVIAYDPFVAPAAAAALGVELVSLEDVFGRAEVVSLHTPWLKETEGLITGAHFEAMKPGAAFINTARGAVVRESEMIAVLQRRPDLTAVLDVTYPEPPVAGSPLYTLPNVILTPHIAGSMDNECRRMGRYMVEEAGRLLRGEPLKWAISREQAARLA